MVKSTALRRPKTEPTSVFLHGDFVPWRGVGGGGIWQRPEMFVAIATGEASATGL